MRFDHQVVYPHPVLRPDTDDYLDGEFQVVSEISVTPDQNVVRFSISFALSVPEILDLVDGGKAQIGLLVSCRDSFFRQIYEIESTGSTEIVIDGGSLHGQVEYVPIIYATGYVEDFKSEDFDSDFSDLTFKLKPGALIAHDEPQYFYLERESFAPIESILTMDTDPSLTGYEWELNLESDKVTILVSRQLSEKIQKARNVAEHRTILLNSVYFSAIMGAVTYLKFEDAVIDTTWANVIRQKCASKEINIQAEDPHVITQRLLKHPVRALCETNFASEQEING